jgi:probable phosphoglycerate mutase
MAAQGPAPESAQHEPECWLVRHGETEWSSVRKHTGRTDLPLTPNGEQDAAALAARLSGVHFDLVLASPLQRAWRTALLAGLSPEAEPNAMEWDYGVYEGRTTEQIRAENPDWSIWDSPVPEGENVEDVAKRADAVVARVRSQAPERAILVAHAHFLRIFAARWIDESALLAEHLVLETAKLSVLAWDRGVPVMERWNA